jgi:hypothetical protein
MLFGSVDEMRYSSILLSCIVLVISVLPVGFAQCEAGGTASHSGGGIYYVIPKVDLSRAKIVVLSSDKKIMANAGDMLCDEIDKRTRIGLDIASELPGPTQVAILIGTYLDLQRQGYEPPKDFEVPRKADAYSVWIDSTTRTGNG